MHLYITWTKMRQTQKGPKANFTNMVCLIIQLFCYILLCILVLSIAYI